MGFVRDLWSDLVEKRLWPLALVIVAAMIAAPMVLAGGSDEAPPPAAPAADDGRPNAGDVSVTPVSLDQSPARPAPKGGYKDPFAGAARAAEDDGQIDVPTAPGVRSASGGRPGDGATGSSGASPAPGGTSPAGTAPVGTPDADGAFAGYRVDLHWGPAGAAGKLTDVTRLRRLDAGDAPLLVYLGTRVHGDRALFLLATPVSAAGDGRCFPHPRACQIVQLRPGESHFFDVDTGNGGVEQYELDLDRIAERHADTALAASARRGKHSKLGARVVEQAIDRGRDYVTSFRYVPRRGIVVRDEQATLAWLGQATYAEIGQRPR